MMIPVHGFSEWLIQHGNIGLYLLLALGIVGLPIPDETLIVFAGLLCAHGQMNLFSTFPIVILGAITGITVSYLLGFFAGQGLLLRHGYLIGLTENHLEKAHLWFERAGKWLLTFGYFIPGVRHLSGFVAGATYLNYMIFALFAYSGATLWASTFFSIGYFFFEAWKKLGLDHIFS